MEKNATRNFKYSIPGRCLPAPKDDYAKEAITYVFKKAFQDSFFEDEEEFFLKRWGSCVEINRGCMHCSMKLSTLYAVCASSEYLDLHLEPDAPAYLNGMFAETDLQELMSVIKGLGVACTIENELEDSIPQVYDAILSADDVRLSQCEKFDNLASEIMDSAREFFRLNAFKGILTYKGEIGITDEVILGKIQAILKENEFRMIYTVGEVTKILIKPMMQRGDYSITYSEEDLCRILNNATKGGMFYFVAVYCKRVLSPLLTKVIVQSVVEALSNVDHAQNLLKIEKMATEMDIYSQLYFILRQKGFEVEDAGNVYILRW